MTNLEILLAQVHDAIHQYGDVCLPGLRAATASEEGFTVASSARVQPRRPWPPERLSPEVNPQVWQLVRSPSRQSPLRRAIRWGGILLHAEALRVQRVWPCRFPFPVSVDSCQRGAGWSSVAASPG